MRRALKILSWCLAVLLAIPLLLTAAVMVGANTAPGRRLIETLAPRLSGGMVRIDGLSGRFPDALRAGTVTIADADGVWLTVNDAVLDWSPRHLLEGRVAIERLEARRVRIDRLPASSGGSSFTIPPLPGVVSRLRVARLEIGPAVAGQPITAALQGAGEIAGRASGEAHLAITALTQRGGAPLDHYLVELSMDPARLHATLSVSESAHGLIAGLAGLPDLGSIAIAASADGPLNALATKATIEAGSLRGGIDGQVDATGQTGDLRFSVVAPAMTPGPGIGWASVRLEGTVQGPLTAPRAQASLAADQVTAEGGTVGSVRATVTGDASGKTDVRATLDGLRVPGPSPDLLAGGPLTLDGTVQLADAHRPFSLSLRHSLFAADATGDIERGQMHVTVPDLAPFAAIGGVDLRGHTDLTIAASRSGDRIDLTAKGGIGITNGPRPMPVLVGDGGTIDLAASVTGEDVRVTRFSLAGALVNASASGQFVNHVLGADWTLALSRSRTDPAGTGGHDRGARARRRRDGRLVGQR